MVQAKRAFAAFLLAFGLAMAIASLAERNWVSQNQVEDVYGRYELGLQEWQLVDKPGVGDGEQNSYDTPGVSPFLWNDALLGMRSDWEQAGRAALGLGVVGVVFLGFALLLSLAGMAKADFTKVPGAVCALLAAFSLLLGAILYEGLRPSWGGDMGYNNPIGLYMAGGLMAAIASITLWSADYTGPKRYDNRA